MEFSDLIDRRQSIRAYEKLALDESTIEKILQIARMAPSAGDLQSYRIVAVLSPTAKGALSDAAGQYYITQAALVLVFFADVERSAAKYYDRGMNLFSLQDATIAAAYAQLAATDLGLGSCWVGTFNDEKVRRAVRAPKGLKPVAILTIGKAAEEPARPSRRRMDELMVRDRFD
jgi:nitroreductase